MAVGSKLRAWGSHPSVQAYEARQSTGSPAICFVKGQPTRARQDASNSCPSALLSQLFSLSPPLSTLLSQLSSLSSCPSALLSQLSSLQLQTSGSNRTFRPYQDQSGNQPSPAVAKGRLELPRLIRHDVLNVACLPFHHLAESLFTQTWKSCYWSSASDPCGIRTHLFSLRN